jgi:hypothetical protein
MSEINETFNKNEFNETCKTFFKTSTTMRIKTKEDHEILLKARENLKSDIFSRIELEKQINLLLSLGSSAAFDIPYALSIYNESLNVIYPKLKIMEKLFILISNKKEEILVNDLKKLTSKDKPVVIKHLEEINSNKLKISNETISKLKELLK